VLAVALAVALVAHKSKVSASINNHSAPQKVTLTFESKNGIKIQITITQERNNQSMRASCLNFSTHIDNALKVHNLYI